VGFGRHLVAEESLSVLALDGLTRTILLFCLLHGGTEEKGPLELASFSDLAVAVPGFGPGGVTEQAAALHVLLGLTGVVVYNPRDLTTEPVSFAVNRRSSREDCLEQSLEKPAASPSPHEASPS
jgi:hypothetical protein